MERISTTSLVKNIFKRIIDFIDLKNQFAEHLPELWKNSFFK
jgi:hypothetical protein